jgi:hypothetical protein
MKSPHSTTPEQAPNVTPPTPSRNIVGVDVSHLSDDQHSALTSIIQAVVNLLIGLFFKK